MFKKHTYPSLEAGLLIILIVISIVSLGMYTGPKVAGMATAGVTGMVVEAGQVYTQSGSPDITIDHIDADGIHVKWQQGGVEQTGTFSTEDSLTAAWTLKTPAPVTTPAQTANPAVAASDPAATPDPNTADSLLIDPNSIIIDVDPLQDPNSVEQYIINSGDPISGEFEINDGYILDTHVRYDPVEGWQYYDKNAFGWYVITENSDAAKHAKELIGKDYTEGLFVLSEMPSKYKGVDGVWDIGIKDYYEMQTEESKREFMEASIEGYPPAKQQIEEQKKELNELVDTQITDEAQKAQLKKQIEEEYALPEAKQGETFQNLKNAITSAQPTKEVAQVSLPPPDMTTISTEQSGIFEINDGWPLDTEVRYDPIEGWQYYDKNAFGWYVITENSDAAKHAKELIGKDYLEGLFVLSEMPSKYKGVDGVTDVGQGDYRQLQTTESKKEFMEASIKGYAPAQEYIDAQQEYLKQLVDAQNIPDEEKTKLKEQIDQSYSVPESEPSKTFQDLKKAIEIATNPTLRLEERADSVGIARKPGESDEDLLKRVEEVEKTYTPPKTLEERAKETGLSKRKGESDEDFQKRIEEVEKKATEGQKLEERAAKVGMKQIAGESDTDFLKRVEAAEKEIVETTATTLSFEYDKDKAKLTVVRNIEDKISLTIEGEEAIDKWGNVYKKVEDRWEVASTKTEPKAPKLKGTSGAEIDEFLTEMSIYSEKLKLYGENTETQQVVKEHINLVKKRAEEYKNSPSTRDKERFEAAVQVLTDKLIEVKARGGSTTDQLFNLDNGNPIEKKVAEEYFRKKADDPDIMDRLAEQGDIDRVHSAWSEPARKLIIEIALENGKDSEAYKKAGQKEKDLIDYHLPKKEFADNLREKGNLDIYYNWEKREYHSYDGRIIKKESISGDGQNWRSYRFEYTGENLDNVGKTGAEKYFSDDILKGLRESASANGIKLDEKQLAEGKIIDKLGNSYGWDFDPDKNEVRIKMDSKTPPPTIKLNGRTQKLTEVKDYKGEHGEVLYKSEDDTYFKLDGTDWTKADEDKQKFSGKISKVDPINEKDPNSPLIRSWFDVNNGKKENDVASISLVQDTKDDTKDIPIDKETLSMIQKTNRDKGSIETTGNKEGSEIIFKNKAGQETTRIAFSPSSGQSDYKTEGNKLTGIKSQTDYEYSLDLNQDGEITEEERKTSPSKQLQMTKRFTAIEEDDGKVTTTWYAADFKYGNDDIYYADMHMQTYKEDKKGRTIPDELTYYYVEGGSKGDDGAAELHIKVIEGELVIDGPVLGTIAKVVNGEVTLVRGGSKGYAERAKKRAAQDHSRRAFAEFEFRLTQFRGLSGWSQLILSEDTIANWREDVDQVFSSAYIGSQYWVSEICSKDIPKSQPGTFLMETKDGLFDVIAHVEGEKTVIEGPQGPQYIYKLTFSVRNPRNSPYEDLGFNVYLHGTQRTAQLYSQDHKVSEGDSFTRGSGNRKDGKTTYDKQHGKPIVQYSSINYDQICIRFNPSVKDARGKPRPKICNSIVQYRGSPTEYQERVVGSTTVGTYTPSGDPYEEADF